AAGRRLRADHATVGRRVDALERTMGVKLFERHARGYGLTRQGEQLLRVAEAMEREAARAEDGFGGGFGGGGVGGTVRISTLEGFGTHFLAPRIGRLMRDNPELVIEWLTIGQIVALSRREADVTVTLAPPQAGRFVAEKLCEYRLLIYGSREYLAGAPPLREAADLERHAFAGYIEDLVFTRGLDYLGGIAGGRVRARLQNSSLGAQLAATKAGLCLCVLPVFVAAAEPELLPVLADEVSLTRAYWMSVPADEAESARVRRVRSFIREEVAAAGSLFVEGGVGVR
ncbi:MAG: LysR family transcriptional regulator, partial [Gluconacetobacter diazotrophicus]|nr:LysR family transcriptional regulator [Gluconacetobacter diazotrophicus]